MEIADNGDVMCGELDICACTPAGANGYYDPEAEVCVEGDEAPQAEACGYYDADRFLVGNDVSRQGSHTALGRILYALGPAFIVPFLSLSGCAQEQCDRIERGGCSVSGGDIPVTIMAGASVPDYGDGYSLDVLSRGITEALGIVSALNPCLLEGLGGVYINDMPSRATYSVGSRDIGINPSIVEDDVRTSEDHVFVMMMRLGHEIGHHLYEHVLATYCGDLRQEFEQMYERSLLVVGPDQFLNSEAAMSADEDMAVCAAYYLFYPNEFLAMIAARGGEGTLLGQKYAFLQRLLG